MFYGFDCTNQLEKAKQKLRDVEIYNLLNVPYYSQLDNRREPMRSCNISCCAMAANFLKPGLFESDDHYADVLRPYGDTTIHDAHTRMLKDCGIVSEFYYNLSYSVLTEQLSSNKPVVIGVYHRGSLQAPTGGHMVVVIGKTYYGFVAHDPFGSPFHYSSDDGSFCYIPNQSLDRRWLTDGVGTGWGRIFQ